MIASPAIVAEEPAIFAAGVRPSIKAAVRLDDARGDLHSAAFAFDAYAVGRFGFGNGRSFGLWPELGYVSDGTNGRFASIGMGVASQTPRIYTSFWSGLSLGLVPHVLVGSREGGRAFGARTSALAEIYLDDGNAWGIEIAHQIVDANGRVVHEMLIGISLVLLPINP